MATYSKITLQPTAGTTTSGIPINVTGVSGSPTVIHTTQTSATAFDQIWLYATNTYTSQITLTIQVGGGSGSAPANQITMTIPAQSGLTLVVPGLILAGTGSAGNTVTAFYVTTGGYGYINIFGYVNRVQ